MKKLYLNQMQALPYAAEEALNRLRVNFGLCGSQFKKVIITSSIPNEGKSFVAAHLWRLLAEAGHKVILVDADMRKSVIQSRYQITTDDPHAQGLAHYLAGQTELEDVIYATDIRNGYFVPTFRTVNNPAILLQNNRFSLMLDRLSQVCDYVLIDTPPLTNVSDGGLIASLCDGAILIVRSGFTSRRLVADSIKQIQHANCKLLGTVLNRVKIKDSPYYRKYTQYYGHYGYVDRNGTYVSQNGVTVSSGTQPADADADRKPPPSR